MVDEHTPPGLEEADWNASGTVYDLAPLNRALRPIERLDRRDRPSTLVELGCGIGSIASYLGERLDITTRYGVDVDGERLAKAAERGITTFNLDLETARLPLSDDSVDLVVSFGAFEHLVWFDRALAEATRVLSPDGWLILSMPNLGSYVNRVALLCGYQPRDIEVSRQVVPGVLPIYRSYIKSLALGHVHSATLRCMTELLDYFGLETVGRQGMAPYASGFARVLDALFRWSPSLSRRFILTARLRPTARSRRDQERGL